MTSCLLLGSSTSPAPERNVADALAFSQQALAPTGASQQKAVPYGGPHAEWARLLLGMSGFIHLGFSAPPAHPDDAVISFIQAADIAGFDSQGPDTPAQQQNNVLAVLKHLDVDPISTVWNVGSGIRPLVFPPPWTPPLNLDQEKFQGERPAEVAGAHFAPLNILHVAQFTENVPSLRPYVLLLYRMAPFITIYNRGHETEFWQAAWKLILPGGWLLIMIPPWTEIHQDPIFDTYRQAWQAIDPERPSEVRFLTVDGTMAGVLAVALRKATAYFPPNPPPPHSDSRRLPTAA